MSAFKPKILVVDDDYIIREFCSEFLMQNGFVVDVASDGAEAIEKMKNHLYDLVISDINMPGVNGIELYGHIGRQYPFLKDRFLFITGNFTPDAETQKMFVAMGEKLLRKPFRPNGFLKAARFFTGSPVAGLISQRGSDKRSEERFIWESDLTLHPKQEGTDPVAARTLDVSTNGMRIKYFYCGNLRPGTEVEVCIPNRDISRPGTMMWSKSFEELYIAGIRLQSPLPFAGIINAEA